MAEASVRGQPVIMRMKGIQTIVGGCCTRWMLHSVDVALGVCSTRCMIFLVYAVFGGSCTLCMLYSVNTVLAVCCHQCQHMIMTWRDRVG
jgi:hypothetical protein